MYCQIETLRRCFPASIRRTLDELPETLDGTYEQTLQGIDKQKRDYAYRLLQCLVISKRPLRVEELAELFAIQPSVETTPTFDASLRPENPEEFVLSACSTLVTVVNHNRQKVVQFSHFSVREYLTSHRIAISNHVSRFHILPRPAHALLATSCLSVLLQLDVLVDKNKIRNFPLALYAAQYWVDHAQFENVSSDIKYEMECLFDKNKPHFATWLRIYNMDDPGSTPRHSTPHPVPLYYAALCGFRDIAEHLLDAHPRDINARGGRLVTPLYAALETGHSNVAKLLVEHGADVESLNHRSQTPLHIASYRGYTEVATLLIDRGADINAEFYRETPLDFAFKRGHRDVFQLLLDHGANANRSDNVGKTLLHRAFESGRDDDFWLLLDHGANANRPDNDGKALLHRAFESGRDDVFRYLLDHDADANHPDNRGLTTLHLASQSGHEEIVQLLLGYGVDINRRDNRSLSPLHHASMGGLNGTVQLLLNHGADVNLPGNRGLTALHHASLRGLNDTIRLLLDHGADKNRRDNRGGTALHHASLWGLNDVVQLLIDHSGVASCPEKSVLTPLHNRQVAHHRDNRG